MRVETDVKLGFKDVLIRPKRSTLKSRAMVELERTFTFLHSKRQWRMIRGVSTLTSLPPIHGAS